jgi:hypothetical protein
MRTALSVFLLTTLIACTGTRSALEHDVENDESPADVAYSNAPAQQQNKTPAYFIFLEPKVSSTPCGPLPWSTRDLRTACDEFGGAATSSEDEALGYRLTCDWASGSAHLTFQPNAHAGTFDVAAPSCTNHFAFIVADLSGPTLF